MTRPENAELNEKRTNDGQQLKETFQKPPEVNPTATTKVYKPDGTLQCGMGQKVSIDKVAQELKGINVIEKYSGNDGMMHSTVCGGLTGSVYIFVIPTQDLSRARELGFKPFNP